MHYVNGPAHKQMVVWVVHMYQPSLVLSVSGLFSLTFEPSLIPRPSHCSSLKYGRGVLVHFITSMNSMST